MALFVLQARGRVETPGFKEQLHLGAEPVSSLAQMVGSLLQLLLALGSQTAVTRRWIQREQRKWNPAKITVPVRTSSLLVAQNVLKM